MVFMRKRNGGADRMWQKQVSQARKQTRGGQRQSRPEMDNDDNSYDQSYADPYYNNGDGSIESYDNRYDTETAGDETYTHDATNTRDATNTHDGTYASGMQDQWTNEQMTNDQSYSVNYSAASGNYGIMSLGSQSYGMTLDTYGNPVPRDAFAPTTGFGVDTFETFESNPTMEADATEKTFNTNIISYGGANQFNNWENRSATQSILKNGNKQAPKKPLQKPQTKKLISKKGSKTNSKKGNKNKKGSSARIDDREDDSFADVKLQRRRSSRSKKVETDEDTVDVLRQMHYKQEQKDITYSANGNLVENLVLNNPFIACLAAPIIPCLVCYNRHTAYNNEIIARKNRVKKVSKIIY